ncbi:MAG: polysaccharide biosynthesis tyrosine autokinase [Balneolales bacterium]
MRDHYKAFLGNNFGKKSAINGSANVYAREDAFANSQKNLGSFIDLRKVIVGLLRFKLLILLVTLAAGTAAWFYTEEETRLYSSSGTLHVGNSTQSSDGGMAGIFSRNFGMGADKSIPNQLQFLQSRHFFEQVTDEVIAREFMSNGERFPILMTEDDIPVERSRRQIAALLNKRTVAERVGSEVNILRITHVSNDPYETMELPNLIMDEYVKISNEQSRSSIRATLDFLKNIMIEEVEERLNKSEDEIENFLRDVEGGMNLSGHTSRLLDRMVSIEEQIEYMEIDRELISQRRANLKSELAELEPGLAEQMKSATNARVKRLQETLAELSIERMLIINKNPSLRNNEDQEPRLQQVNNEIEIYKKEIDEMVINSLSQSTGYLVSETGDANRRVLELRRELNEQQIELYRLGKMNERARNMLLEYEEEMSELPKEHTRLARLERSRMLNEKMYTDLSARQMELALMEQSTDGIGQIFDDALEPNNPFYPNVPLILTFGLVSGFIIAASGVTFIVLRNTRIESIDVLKQFNIPVMSVVPEMDTIIKEQFIGKPYVKVEESMISSTLISLLDSMSNVSEAYRRMYNNLRYSNPDGSNKIFIVTSPGKGEGKSTCISNLAITMAASGKRVLLMDCDFRRPHQHHLFGGSRKMGITNYLFDDHPISSIISATPVMGLEIITAGADASNPSLVTNSLKMQELIKALNDQYDYILIDTPPFGIITDAAPLIKLADGVITVVRFNKTTTPELNQLLENLQGISSDVIGMVLMDYDPLIGSGYYSYNRMFSNNYAIYKSYHQSSTLETDNKKFKFI